MNNKEYIKVDGSIQLEDDKVEDFVDDLEEFMAEHAVKKEGRPDFFFKWDS